MDKEIYTDQIEAYLLDRLDTTEKIAFQQVIEKDPILKNELQFQHDIIEAIRENRKLELKSRLNAIQIQQTPLHSVSRMVLLLGGVLIVSTLVMVLMLQFNPFASQQPIAQKAQTSPEQADILLPQEPEQENTSVLNPESEEETLPESTSIQEPLNNPITLATPSPSPVTPQEKNLEEEENIGKLTVYAEKSLAVSSAYTMDKRVDKSKRFMSKVDNILEADKSTYAFEKDDDEDVKGIFDGTNEAKLEEIAQRNTLSYQYYNNQLFLYNYQGNYKVIRTTLDQKERHFLYYQEAYYALEFPQIEKKELTVISDASLIDQLTHIRVSVYGK